MSNKGIELYTKDSDFVNEKSKHVLEWVRRRFTECISHSGSSASKKYGDDVVLCTDHNRRLKEALIGHSRSSSEKPSPQDLRAEIISGGATNVCVRVWYDPTVVQMSKKSKTEEEMDTSSSNHSPQGVFVKVALPHARWAGPQKKCDVARLDNEFRCLERLDSICPGVTTIPIMCGFDEVENDGSRYLVTEFLPGHWEQYIEHFKRGNVDVKVAKTLGFALAKLHILSPTRFGGRDGILNDMALEFMSKSHYGKLLQDITLELERTDFVNERTGQFDKGALNFHEYLKSNPELFCALSRHFDNYVNPPAETATFCHLDSHPRNILVQASGSQLESSNNVSSPEKLNSDERFDIGRENILKLIDMEFSNWGPCGADIGLFISCVLFYSLSHACGDKEVDTTSIISIISAIWNSYTDAFFHFAKKQDQSEHSVIRSLYFIAREALGWAGAWAFRFTIPKLFRLCVRCDLMFTLPEDIEEKLRKHKSSSGDGGLEIFRSHANTLAGKSILMGFGDSAVKEIPQVITMEDCNGVIESLIKEITSTVAILKRLIQETDVIDTKK